MLLLPLPLPPPPPCNVVAIIKGDPHLTFAHGGKADFRGRDGKLFCFLSTDTVLVNVMTEDGDFRLNGALVHGSWITQAHVSVQTSAGPLRFSHWAYKISPTTLIGWSNGTCAGEPFKLVGMLLANQAGRLLAHPACATAQPKNRQRWRTKWCSSPTIRA